VGRKASLVALLLLVLTIAQARSDDEAPLVCKNPDAQKALVKGFEFQKDNNTDDALLQYKKCLELESNCISCLYEIGWSHWKKGEWKEVIHTWEETLKADPKHPKISQFLPTARENLKIVESKNKIEVYRNKTDLMIQSTPKDAPVVMTFVGRWQAYNPQSVNPLDHFDRDIDSPKSAIFSKDGNSVYVNSLEGARTVVFDSRGLTKTAVIPHKFKSEKELFSGKPPFAYTFPSSQTKPNEFSGKPVEGVVTHGGRFLWITYYRRDYDEESKGPSAMALIETATNKVIRVFGTGPIAKYVQVSHDGTRLAVSHWGDNTVGLFNISGEDPSKFSEITNLVVEKQLSVSEMTGNRDKNCGFCIRGLAFTKDDKFLFVSRMKQGGIAMFDMKSKEKPFYMGTVIGISPGPRDLQLSPDGEYLYSGCNSSGFISKIPIAKLLEKMKGHTAKNEKVKAADLNVVSTFAGMGIRSIKLSPNGKYLFAAVNQGSELQSYQSQDMKLISRIPVDSFPVGLDISPDGSQVWVTSQGRNLKGGNSIGVFQIKYKLDEIISVTKDPRKK
jgi:DNA-binding beta-propeller fold protein YncE